VTAEVTSSAPSRKPARRWRLGAAVLVLGALLVLTSSADAVVLSAVTIDGPSEDIVGFGGVAMAEDGTGGAVYLKRVEGVAHVFVARYAQGRWLTPVQVDTAQPFAASWPEIGAANGGELVVVWATPFASVSGHPVDELLSSTLGPGSASFGPARVVDRNIGSGTGTSPALAMSPTGQADVVYRVLDQEEGQLTSIPLLRPEDVVEEVRVAHFEGETWSPPLPVNRNPAVSMRPPTPVNAPQIAIGPTGNGIVVWQEPDEEGVARIWARRLFGRTLDYVMPVSAASLNSKPVTADADAPNVTITRSGQAEVAYRQATGPGSPLPGPRVLINTLPDGIAGEGTEFEGAQVVDPELAAAAAVVGPPDLDSDEKLDVRLLYDANGTPRVFQGNDGKLAASLSLGPPFAGSEPFAATVMNKAGGGISAWPSQDADGRAVVAVREDFPDGAVQTALVSGGDGGPVGELAVGRSGLGDGLVAFRQGPLGDAAIVADQVTAPPVRFAAAAPEGWIKPAGAEVTWQPAESANGPLRYSVVLDGRLLPAAAGALSMRLDRRGLASGRHQIQVLATDDDDQSTLTYPVALRVDGTPPSVRIARARGHVIVVRVADAQSGVSLKTVGVAFGDGTSARGRASFRHRYSRAGIYRVSVRARDKLGNSVTLQRLVSVR
jgi:PKD domain